MKANQVMQIRSVATLAVTLGLLAGSMSTASAEVGRVTDQRNDAVPAIDITHARLRNGPSRLIAITQVVNLIPHYAGTLLFIDTATRQTYKRIYQVISKPRAGGGYNRQLIWVETGSEAPPQHRVPCAGLRVRWRTGPASDVQVVLPQRCLGTYAGSSRFDMTVLHRAGLYNSHADGTNRGFTVARG